MNFIIPSLQFFIMISNLYLKYFKSNDYFNIETFLMNIYSNLNSFKNLCIRLKLSTLRQRTVLKHQSTRSFKLRFPLILVNLILNFMALRDGLKLIIKLRNIFYKILQCFLQKSILKQKLNEIIQSMTLNYHFLN